MAGRLPVIGGRKALSAPKRVEFEKLRPSDGTPEPPDHLDAHGLYAWVMACRSLIPARLVSHIDLIALEGFAEAFARWRRAEAECRASGDYDVTPKGFRQISAARVNANKALAQVMVIGARFGMTPVERIKTAGSAQGDLDLGQPARTGEDASDDGRAMGSIFRPRPAGSPALAVDNTGGPAGAA